MDPISFDQERLVAAGANRAGVSVNPRVVGGYAEVFDESSMRAHRGPIGGLIMLRPCVAQPPYMGSPLAQRLHGAVLVGRDGTLEYRVRPCHASRAAQLVHGRRYRCSGRAEPSLERDAAHLVRETTAVCVDHRLIPSLAVVTALNEDK
jgi:hypothetical protein